MKVSAWEKMIFLPRGTALGVRVFFSICDLIEELLFWVARPMENNDITGIEISGDLPLEGCC